MEFWTPTCVMQFAANGRLQQRWTREVGVYSEHWKRTLYHTEYDWRDVPIMPAETPFEVKE